MSTPTSSASPRHSPQKGRWAWRLGSVAGIDLYLHATFVALLVWIAVSHLGQRHGLPGVAGALVLNLAVFGVVVLHELGHALVARRFGINTRDITLWPIGGIARLERMPDKPRQELLVAAAGPAVNLGLAGLLAGLMFLFGRPLAPPQVELLGGSFLSALLWINISLGLFNLLPAFPMDGGRILRAALALRLDRERATAVAARIGKSMAALLGLMGLLGGHTMLVIIAIFVWMGAHGESAAAAAKAALSGVPVSRTMITEFRALRPQDTIRTAAAWLVSGFQSQFPVLRDGRPVGVLNQADIVRAIAAQRSDAPVDAFMTGNFSLAAPDEAVDVVLDRFQTPDVLVMVVDEDRLVGLLTAENVGEVIALGRARSRERRIGAGAEEIAGHT